MKVLVLSLFLFLTVAVSAQVPQSDTPAEVSVSVKKAYLRSEPSTKAKIVATVKRDTVLQVFAYEPNTKWYLVQYGLRHGWILSSTVNRYSPENEKSRLKGFYIAMKYYHLIL